MAKQEKWRIEEWIKLDVDDEGKIAYRMKAGAKIPARIKKELVGGLLPLNAPSLKEFRESQQEKTQEIVRKSRETFAAIHDSISDPENQGPFPLWLLRKKPRLLPWILGDDTAYRPTPVDLLIVKVAYSERLRKIKESALRGEAKRDEPPSDGPCGQNQWLHNGEIVEGTMQPGAWGVCNFLWQSQEKSSSFDFLYEPATGDCQENCFDFKSAAQKAKQFFDAADIPWRLSVSERHRTVSLVEK